MNIEQIIDRRAQAVLSTDSAYRNADSAETQAEREAEVIMVIEMEVEMEQ